MYPGQVVGKPSPRSSIQPLCKLRPCVASTTFSAVRSIIQNPGTELLLSKFNGRLEQAGRALETDAFPGPARNTHSYYAGRYLLFQVLSVGSKEKQLPCNPSLPASRGIVSIPTASPSSGLNHPT
ncbi:hypothetical protein KCU83_g565, partial [Aureobasidium melanogenum]